MVEGQGGKYIRKLEDGKGEYQDTSVLAGAL